MRTRRRKKRTDGEGGIMIHGMNPPGRPFVLYPLHAGHDEMEPAFPMNGNHRARKGHEEVKESKKRLSIIFTKR